MSTTSNQPRILFVTPEVSFVPACSGKNSDYLNYKSGGFAGFLSNLVIDLYERGADVHIAQPDYRSVFSAISQNSPHIKTRRLPDSRIHLTEDRVFFYAKGPETNHLWENIKISLAFQREVIHQILPRLQPDLIHCHDWMGGLIPAKAAELGIPCIFTLQSCETAQCTLAAVEDIGIDAAVFWQHLFFDRFPVNYEETREINAIDFLLSGIFAARHVTVASPAELAKIGVSRIRFPEAPMGKALAEKLAVGCNVFTEYHAAKIQYIDLYERLLKHPVLRTSVRKSGLHDEFHPYLDLSNLSLETQIGDQYAQT